MMMKALEAAAAEAIDVPGWTNTEPTGAPTTYVFFEELMFPPA